MDRKGSPRGKRERNGKQKHGGEANKKEYRFRFGPRFGLHGACPCTSSAVQTQNGNMKITLPDAVRRAWYEHPVFGATWAKFLKDFDQRTPATK